MEVRLILTFCLSTFEGFLHDKLYRILAFSHLRICNLWSMKGHLTAFLTCHKELKKIWIFVPCVVSIWDRYRAAVSIFLCTAKDECGCSSIRGETYGCLHERGTRSGGTPLQNRDRWALKTFPTMSVNISSLKYNEIEVKCLQFCYGNSNNDTHIETGYDFH